MMTLLAVSGGVPDGVICSNSPQSWTGRGIGRQTALTAVFKQIDM